LTLQIVQNRVDAFVVAFRVAVDEETRVALVRAAEVARVHGRSAVRIASLEWELKLGSAATIYNLRRDQHVRMRIDLNAAGGALVPTINGLGESVVEHEPGWTIEIVAYAAHLAQVGLVETKNETEKIARSMGKVFDARLRRIDLAADVAGWQLQARDRRAFVRRSRVRTSIYAHAPQGHDLRSVVPPAELRASATAYETRQITGFSVGRGDVVARVYDKREELQLDASKHKAPAEEERWRAGGWDGEDKITRVEFQLRGEALKELGARSLDTVHDPATGEIVELQDYLPRIWSTCLQWLRLVQRKTTRTGKPLALTRCPDDPRWEILRSASWGYAAPIRRKRERGGASSAQALGSMLSVAAARGKLADALPESPKAWEKANATKLRELLAIVGSWGVDLIAADMIERWNGPADACVHVAVLWNAARARFARILERERDGPWLKSNRGNTTGEPAQSLSTTTSEIDHAFLSE
jgi:hypothetical protein